MHPQVIGETVSKESKHQMSEQILVLMIAEQEIPNMKRIYMYTTKSI